MPRRTAGWNLTGECPGAEDGFETQCLDFEGFEFPLTRAQDLGPEEAESQRLEIVRQAIPSGRFYSISID
jgi:hypothetical protein